MKKLILIIGIMLSASLWAEEYKYKVCGEIDNNGYRSIENLERCVTEYLDKGWVLWGSPVAEGDRTRQALVKND